MLLRISILETSFTLYLLLVCNGSQFSISGIRLAGTGNNTSCGSTLNLLNCYHMEAVPFSRTRAIEIISRYVPGGECDIKHVSFGWALSFENETEYNWSGYDGNYISGEFHASGSGNYRVVSKLVEYDGDGLKNVLSDECAVTIITKKSLPKIEIGGEISMSSGKHRSANDVNISSKQIGSLVCELSYDVIETPTSSFCNRHLGNDDFSIVPKEYALDGLMYNFKLSIKTGELNIRQSTLELIRVKRKANYTIVRRFPVLRGNRSQDQNR
ncbi:hypothetical protein JTB14_034779 [Gonioctena quinquepunctata]|nr:hypothetical protein JTB14_034779 [Gonioctena quinquepunctata]